MTNTILKISEIKIRYTHRVPLIERPKILTSIDAYEAMLPFFDKDNLSIKEEAVVIFLNRGNRVIGGLKISSGGISGTVVDIRLILSIALKALASNIIIGHNHPSGELAVSKADQECTIKLRKAAELFDIKLLDHLIINSDSYISFGDLGVL